MCLPQAKEAERGGAGGLVLAAWTASAAGPWKARPVAVRAVYSRVALLHNPESHHTRAWHAGEAAVGLVISGALIAAGNMPSTDWVHELKVVELKDECKKRGLAVSGKKADLIERLESFLKENEVSVRPVGPWLSNAQGRLRLAQGRTGAHCCRHGSACRLKGSSRVAGLAAVRDWLHPWLTCVRLVACTAAEEPL